MDIIIIIPAKIDISNPFKGRVAKLAANPKNATRPRPQVAQPGANIPKNIPVKLKAPSLDGDFFLKLTLYITKLKRIPVRKLKIIMLIKLENKILPLKLINIVCVKGIIPEKPLVL